VIKTKKIDEKDFIFISKPLTGKEYKAFSEFLKNRKERRLRIKKGKKVTRELQS
jgi:hypothetical protein